MDPKRWAEVRNALSALARNLPVNLQVELESALREDAIDGLPPEEGPSPDEVALRQRLEEAEAKLKDLSEAKQAAETRVEALRAALDQSREASREELAAVKREAEAKVEAMRASLEESREERRHGLEELAAARQEAVGSLQALGALRVQLESARADLAAAVERAAKVSDAAALVSELQSRRPDEALVSELDSLRPQAARLPALETELSESRRAAELARLRVEKLTAELEDMHKRLEKTR